MRPFATTSSIAASMSLSRATAKACARSLPFVAIDLVLMDLNLPGTDGLALTRELRSKHDIGIIMLTAAGQVVDRIVGLEMGADDYVAKPFEPRELLARVKSVLRRQGKGISSRRSLTEHRPEVVKMGACTLDLAAHHLYDANGEEVPLTSMEFDLLHAFATHPDRVLSRNQLLELAHHREGGCLRPQHRYSDGAHPAKDRNGSGKAAGSEDRSRRRVHLCERSQEIAAQSNAGHPYARHDHRSVLAIFCYDDLFQSNQTLTGCAPRCLASSLRSSSA